MSHLTPLNAIMATVLDQIPPRPVRCNCFDAVNERLQAVNTRLAVGEAELTERVLLQTRRLDKGGPWSVLVYASFCPFCGEPYGEDRGGLWCGSE